MSFFSTDNQNGHDGTARRQGHAHKAALKLLQLIGLRSGLEVAVLAFGKQNHELAFAQVLHPVLGGGLNEAEFFCGDRCGLVQEPEMMSQHARITFGRACDFVMKHHRVESAHAGVICDDQAGPLFRNLIAPFDFDAKVSLHQFEKEMGQQFVKEGFSVRAEKIGQNLVGFYAEQVPHLERENTLFFVFMVYFVLMEKFILAIDQGTTGSRACLVNHQARIVASVAQEHPQIYPKPGWVEHDPEAIWRSVTSTITEVLKKASVRGDQIAAIGITNQRETVVLWETKSGRALHNAIVWQCRRTTEFCNKLKKTSAAKVIKKKTGLIVDPYFSASKIRWLLKEIKPKLSEVRAGTIDAFLLARLTAGESFKTDVSNASRTQLMNIATGGWDEGLLKIFGVPKEILPEICASNEEFGRTKGVPGLPDGIPISGMAGDQQSALFGQTCFALGESKCTFGTGSFLLMNTGAKMVSSKAGLLTTIAWRLKGEKKMTYALEGGAFICGAAVQWLRDEMKFIQASGEVEILAKQVQDTGGVYLVPAFVGLGAPYWDPDARGAIVGMTRGTSRTHLARATLEAMALQNVDILSAMGKDLGRKMGAVRVDGGAVANDLLMQMQADFLGSQVERPKQIESTVLGAAFLAGLGVGYWQSLAEIKKVWALEKSFSPQLDKKKRQQKVAEWHRAIERVRN